MIERFIALLLPILPGFVRYAAAYRRAASRRAMTPAAVSDGSLQVEKPSTR
jgi:hypothetical protein